MLKKTFLIFCILFPLFGNVNDSQIEKVGFVGAQFLKIETGAKGFGMGNAIDPIVNDASAVFSNPAGLTQSPNRSLFSSNGNYLFDSKQSALSISMHLPFRGVIAVSYHGVNSGEMNETTYIQQNGTGNKFSTGSFALGLGYAIGLTDKFSFGIHWKYINEDLLKGLDQYADDYGNGSTWGIDVGTLYLTGYKSLKIGMSIRNFGPDLKLGGNYTDYNNGEEIVDEVTGEVIKHNFKPYGLPLTFRFGVSADPISTESQKLTLAVVGEHPADNLERLNCGLEYTYNSHYHSRLGYVFNHDSKGLTFGFGLSGIPVKSFGKINIDFGYSNFNELDNAWIASIGVQL